MNARLVTARATISRLVRIGSLPPSRFAEAADLWVESWAEAMPGLDFAIRRDWLVTHMAELKRGGTRLRAAFRGKRLLGFVTIDAKTGYIDQIMVASAVKGAGIAAALLDEARRLSPKRLSLNVNEGNPRARRFYEKHGFFEAGRGTSERTGLPILMLRWEAAPDETGAGEATPPRRAGAR